jgi:hypothetical protein
MENRRIADMLALAAGQHGLVTTTQLAAIDIGRSAGSRLLAAGVLEPIGGPGIRRLAGGAPTPHQRLLAAVWAGGPHTVASHRSAAWLHQLDGFTWAAPEITVPRGCGRRPNGVIVHHSTDLAGPFVTTVDGLPATEPTRTLVDLAAHVDADTLEVAFDSALRQGLTSVRRAEAVLRRLTRSGRKGIAPFRRMLDDRIATDGVTDSSFETRLIQVLRRGGLPEPVRQVELHDDAGFIGRFDCAYPPAMVAIEADSVRHHHSRARFEADRERRSRAEAIGWRVPTTTWRQVTRRPQWVARTTAAILDAAGWDWRAAA